MAGVTGLVPARFLTIIAHLVITIVIFWSREENVKACLPLSYSQEEFDQKDLELLIGLSVSLGLFAFELIGFLAGVSMFAHTQGLLSTAAHAAAAVALAFLFDTWECDAFWYIFGFCSAFPAVTEIMVMIGVLAFHKGL